MTTAALVGVLVAAVAWFVARPVLAGAPGGPSPRVRPRAALVAVLVVAAVCAVVLTARAVDPRATGAVRSASASAPSTPAPAATAPSTPAPSTPAPASPTQPSASAAPAAAPPTQEQLEAVATAVARVRAQPRSPEAHLDLARAYAIAQQAQLSTVEYLAVTRLDGANPEANTALALVALAAGQPAAGKKLVDAVLAKHPRYPDALYTRGLIFLMGLHQAGPGVRDLRAYLAAAPYGSHRPAAETLLAMVSDGRRP